MKLIGIDYGTKRIGLAISDETQTLARELAIVSPAEVMGRLKDLLAQDDVEALVLGHPLSLQGTATTKTEEVLRFKQKLEQQLQLPVYLLDERLSSVMAAGLPGGRTNVDSLAAQIILQNYLDANKKED